MGTSLYCSRSDGGAVDSCAALADATGWVYATATVGTTPVRLSLTFDCSGSLGASTTFGVLPGVWGAADTTGKGGFWGVQVEQPQSLDYYLSKGPTSYIATAGSTATRTEDLITVPLSGSDPALTSSFTAKSVAPPMQSGNGTYGFAWWLLIGTSVICQQSPTAIYQPMTGWTDDLLSHSWQFSTTTTTNRMWLDGVLFGSATGSYTVPPLGTVQLGAQSGVSGYNVSGHMSNLKICPQVAERCR